jgi:hypothetical protein
MSFKPIGSFASKTPLVLLSLCIGAWLLPVMKAQTDQPPLSKAPPLWSLAARQVGYDLSMFKTFKPRVGRDRVKIQFLDGQRLALAWLTPDEIVTKPIGPEADVPSHLHLLVLDARTGSKISNHEWSCSSRSVNLAYTASGQWLLSSNQTITLYSSIFEKSGDLRNVRAQEWRNTFVSPSGRSFLSYAPDSTDSRSGQLRDTATLEVLDSWNDVRVAKAYIAYSDHFMLAEIDESAKPQQLYLRKVGGHWDFYHASINDSEPPWSGTYGFVNEETIAIFRGHELVLETVDTAKTTRLALPEAGLYFPPNSASAMSTQGTRFSVILDRFRGLRSDGLDMYPFLSDDRAAVYSIRQPRVTFSVRVKGRSPWPFLAPKHPIWNKSALSPDGQLLGIVSDEGVRVYGLPPDNAAANLLKEPD